jgi:hypothetical protein
MRIWRSWYIKGSAMQATKYGEMLAMTNQTNRAPKASLPVYQYPKASLTAWNDAMHQPECNYSFNMIPIYGIKSQALFWFVTLKGAAYLNYQMEEAHQKSWAKTGHSQPETS